MLPVTVARKFQMGYITWPWPDHAAFRIDISPVD